MSSPVDTILDDWFGEPVEYAEDDRRLKHLYAPLRRLFVRQGGERPKKWEHKVVRKDLYTDKVAEAMDELTVDGWEVVTVQLAETQFVQSLLKWVFILRRERF